MSTASLPSRYWQGSALSPSERRRQWLVNHGLLSPKSSSSRRLARNNLFTRRASSSTSAPSLHDSFVHLQVDDNAVPLVVTRPHSHPDHMSSAASRTLSLPIQDTDRVHITRLRRLPPWFSRNSNSSTPNTPTTTNHTSPRSPSRSSRLRSWFSSRKNRHANQPASARHRAHAIPPLSRSAGFDAPSDFERGRLHQPPDRQVHNRPSRATMPLSAHIPSHNHHHPASNPAAHKLGSQSRARRRAVYKVVDPHMPRHILKPQAQYEQSSWNDYRSRIDKLAEDEQFMNYLTEPVQRHPPVKLPGMHAAKDPQQLAVNKLYPLAFIKLLEAQAKMTADTAATDDPLEEKHRYDDIDGDDEARVERTTSTGLHDMKRFRTVYSPKKRKPLSYNAQMSASMEHIRLIKPAVESGSESSHSSFLSRLTQDNHLSSPSVRYSS